MATSSSDPRSHTSLPQPRCSSATLPLTLSNADGSTLEQVRSRRIHAIDFLSKTFLQKFRYDRAPTPPIVAAGLPPPSKGHLRRQSGHVIGHDRQTSLSQEKYQLLSAWVVPSVSSVVGILCPLSWEYCLFSLPS